MKDTIEQAIDSLVEGGSQQIKIGDRLSWAGKLRWTKGISHPVSSPQLGTVIDFEDDGSPVVELRGSHSIVAIARDRIEKNHGPAKRTESYAPENYMVGDVVTAQEMEDMGAEFEDHVEYIQATTRDGARWRSFGPASRYKKVSKGYKGPYAKG